MNMNEDMGFRQLFKKIIIADLINKLHTLRIKDSKGDKRAKSRKGQAFGKYKPVVRSLGFNFSNMANINLK